jgi:septum formation protein
VSYPFVYLASQSPRRRELLEQLGVKYQLLLADAAEDAEALEHRIGRESPLHYVQRVTALKAGAAIVRLRTRRLQDAPILTADTTVALGSRIFGKPSNDAETREFLSALSGRTHRVLTAVALARSTKLDLIVNTSSVTFRSIKPSEILRYIETGEATGKAGAYAIQGRAAEFVTQIRGSHSGIVGLPLAETALLLRRYRVDF